MAFKRSGVRLPWLHHPSSRRVPVKYPKTPENRGFFQFRALARSDRFRYLPATNGGKCGGKEFGGTMGNLTAAKAKSLSRPGMHGDGEGLYLSVSRSGSRSWVQRISIDGRRRELGLGSFPAIGLAQAGAWPRPIGQPWRGARSAGRKARGKTQGRHSHIPGSSKQTFEANRPRWRNASTPCPGGRRLSATPFRFWVTCRSTGSHAKTCFKC